METWIESRSCLYTPEAESPSFEAEERRYVQMVWGSVELILNPMYLWRRHGIWAPPIQLLLSADQIVLHDKINFLCTVSSHFALAWGPVVLWTQFTCWVIWGTWGSVNYAVAYSGFQNLYIAVALLTVVLPTFLFVRLELEGAVWAETSLLLPG